MNNFFKKLFLLNTILLSIGIIKAKKQKINNDPIEFVKSIYDWHFKNKDQDLENSLKNKSNWFTSKLWKYMVKDWKLQNENKGTIAGIDFDLFTGAQDEAYKYSITRQEKSNNKTIVNIKFDFGEHKNKVKVVLTNINSRWQICNIIYPSIKADLISLFEKIHS